MVIKKRGAPKKPEHLKKIRVSTTLTNAAIKKLDKLGGENGRGHGLRVAALSGLRAIEGKPVEQ